MTEQVKHRNPPREFTAREADDRVDLNRIAQILLSGKWWIIGAVLIALVLAVLYLATAPKRYEADSLLQIQSDNSSPLGSLSSSTSLSFLTGQQVSTAESKIPILTSRDVLGQTVRQLNLATHAHPIDGSFFGSWFGKNESTVDISQFEIPDALRDTHFRLVVHGNRQFELLTQERHEILSGTIGKQATGTTPQGAKISILVHGAYLDGQDKQTFDVVKRKWLSEVHSLHGSLEAEQTGASTDLLTLSMKGTDRAYITRVVNAVSKNFVQENVDARSQNAKQSLQFLEQQLPKLKKQVNQAESKLANYQEKNQPVDLSAEANTLLNEVSNLADTRSQLKLKIAQLKQSYTEGYPEVQAARDQLQELKKQSQELQQKINSLPSSQKQMLGLQRDLKVNTDLYTSLMNRAQELEVLQAGTVGNVRIVDPAVYPVSPVWPRSKLVLFIFLALGFLIGVGIVVLRTAMRRGLVDAAAIEGETGYAVYSVLPVSAWLERTSGRRRGQPEPLLARDRPNDGAVEALRSLRTSLRFAQMESGSNVVLVTGPSPGVGKSFISMNLGHLLADAGQRVIVVDADMRRGRIHTFLDKQDRAPGLSNVLGKSQQISEVVRTVTGSRLEVITSGTTPPNPAELLLREDFTKLIDQLSRDYAMVIIDAPPVLAVADAGVIANALDASMAFMVLRSGQHPAEEIDEAIARFTRQGGKLSGLVLNQYSPKIARATGGYQHYQYQYASDDK